jgi:hypothetical protein
MAIVAKMDKVDLFRQKLRDKGWLDEESGQPLPSEDISPFVTGSAAMGFSTEELGPPMLFVTLSNALRTAEDNLQCAVCSFDDHAAHYYFSTEVVDQRGLDDQHEHEHDLGLGLDHEEEQDPEHDLEDAGEREEVGVMNAWRTDLLCYLDVDD